MERTSMTRVGPTPATRTSAVRLGIDSTSFWKCTGATNAVCYMAVQSHSFVSCHCGVLCSMAVCDLAPESDGFMDYYFDILFTMVVCDVGRCHSVS